MTEATLKARDWIERNLDIDHVHGMAYRAAAIDGRYKSAEPRIEPTPSRLMQHLCLELHMRVPRSVYEDQAEDHEIEWSQLASEVMHGKLRNLEVQP